MRHAGGVVSNRAGGDRSAHCSAETPTAGTDRRPAVLQLRALRSGKLPAARRAADRPESALNYGPVHATQLLYMDEIDTPRRLCVSVRVVYTVSNDPVPVCSS